MKDPMPPRGTDPFSRIRMAVMLGRRAVELHHAGRYERSRELWVDCSAAWTEVGDTTRANMARAYAEQGYFSHRPPTLSERVQAAVRVPTSGRRILSRSRR